MVGGGGNTTPGRRGSDDAGNGRNPPRCGPGPPGGTMDRELEALVAVLPRIDLDDLATVRALLADAAEAGIGLAGARHDLTALDVHVRRVPGAPGSPDVGVRIYRPTSPGTRPVLVYCHGGAFVLGQVDLFDGIAGGYALDADAVVVSVDYRLAPEDPYPAAVEDAYAVLCWAASNPAELGADGRLAVGGASAGGGLAAALALMARDRSGPELCFQLLVYPVLDDRMETASVRTFTDTPLWNALDTARMWDYYLGADRGDVSPYAAPARAADLGGLPPAYLLTCELDPLRDEGLAYGQRLLQAGVPVDLRNMVGTFHGFDVFPSEVSRAAQAEQAAALRRALHP
jgi:acetyl esterase/lipase